MKPLNKGRRIQIRVNNRQRTGYWSGRTVGWYIMQRWFEFPATTEESARDAIRNYFTTLDALYEGNSPEYASRTQRVPAGQGRKSAKPEGAGS